MHNVETSDRSDNFLVNVEPYGKEVTWVPSETLLQALMRQFYGRQGHPPFFGCRRGGCASCKVRLIRGVVEHHSVYSRAALRDEEKEQGFILACKSLPTSDITICLTKRLERLAGVSIQPMTSSTQSMNR
ncbi:MAG: 2Fe-2S iron-sulfur cluster binding domain-containing protein [Alicyclobacillus herbarius]|uniref:2Fe-2S iron-sulfur cluster-binding protein n=1 Tax=Alicyclobacillus herbarius TaxID=122960 RepID=UPI002357F8FC|nr:2Fe-2S iron-sulfur cluster binding domain-containing protein [Alicyclobacillus herbarius]MCL6633412.1 2Fe-2S iron-sulfur cluster binding domain-containing protein [Alicyclobacillus herbarius]